MSGESYVAVWTNPAGWSACGQCATPPGPPTHQRSNAAPPGASTCNFASICLPGQALTSSVPYGSPVQAGHRALVVYSQTQITPARGTVVTVYGRSGTEATYPPRYRPTIQPDPYPVGDPEALPIKRPVETPRPMPIWPGIRPPAPRDRPEPPLAMARSPVRNGSPAMGVRQGRRPAVGVSTGTAPREPSGPRERERKFLASPLLMAVLRAYEGLTELDDFVDAIWESLPKKLRTKGQRVGMAQKLLDIYNNADSISITDAVANLMANAIEDAIVGRLQGAAGKALRDMQLSPRSQSASDVMLMPRGRNFNPTQRSQ